MEAALPNSSSSNEPVVFHIDWALIGLFNLLSFYEFETVLDIGSGAGEHARLFRHFGKKVYTIDIAENADYVGDFLDVKIDRKFDVVWCSHVLEHQRNVGKFLEKIYDDCLDENGILFIGLPIHPRTQLIPGHVTNWNAGLLSYNLIYAGFDCSKAKFIHGYDLNYIVCKAPAVGPELRKNSVVDCCMHEITPNTDPFSYLAKYFPIPPQIPGSAETPNHNWEMLLKLPFKPDTPPIKMYNRFVMPDGLVIGPASNNG